MREFNHARELLMPDEAPPGATEKSCAAPAVPGEKDQPQKATASAPTEPSEPAGEGPERWILKHWRPLAFLAIFLVTAFTGWHYKGLADPGHVGQRFVNQAPITINVYVSNPKISTRVIANVYCIGPVPTNKSGPMSCSLPMARAWLDLSLKVKAPRSLSRGRILVTSSAPSDSNPGKAPVSFSGRKPTSYSYYKEYDLRMFRRPGTASNEPVDTFLLPPVLQKTRESIFMHLPAIGGLELPRNSGAPALLMEEQPQSKDVSDIIYNPWRGPRPKGYLTLHNGNPPLFWLPNNFSVTETLLDAMPLTVS
jgi:hypothetical protein